MLLICLINGNRINKFIHKMGFPKVSVKSTCISSRAKSCLCSTIVCFNFNRKPWSQIIYTKIVEMKIFEVKVFSKLTKIKLKVQPFLFFPINNVRNA